MDHADLLARAQIQDCVLRYCQGIDRGDAELVKTAYWPDAFDDHGTFRGNAWEFADYATSRLREGYVATMHSVMNHHITVEGPVAWGECANVSYHLRDRGDGTHELHTWWGGYVDRYTERDGEWRIAHRVCVHHWTKSEVIDTPMPINGDLFTQGRRTDVLGALRASVA